MARFVEHELRASLAGGVPKASGAFIVMPTATSDLLRAFLPALFADLRRRARRQQGVRHERCGLVIPPASDTPTAVSQHQPRCHDESERE